MQPRRMTENEYMQRISGLLEKIRAESGNDEDDAAFLERYQEAEFDLTVEYRLGSDFPPDRREALRTVHRRTQEQSAALREKYLSGALPKQDFLEQMQAATAALAKQYAAILTHEELTAFFGHGEGAYTLPFTQEEEPDNS